MKGKFLDLFSFFLTNIFQACQLPLFSYIVERLCACCYEQAWYAKLGGVVSIKFLMERLPLIWVLQNQQTFLKALLFVMMDLTGEVFNIQTFFLCCTVVLEGHVIIRHIDCTQRTVILRSTH